MKSYFTGLLVFLAAFIFFVISPATCQANETYIGNAQIQEEELAIGRIVNVGKEQLNAELLKGTGMRSSEQIVQVKVLDGILRGRTFEIKHEITDNPAFNIKVAPNQEVVLAISKQPNNQSEVSIADYHRMPVIGWLIVVFLAFFLFFGRMQGVKALLGLIITVLLISGVLLPLSMRGVNPLLTAIGICLVSTASIVLLIGGFSKKSVAAISGTVGGVVVAGVTAQLVIWFAPLTGLSSEEAQILRGSVLVQSPEFYSGLLAAGMLIGALGVIMDVGISIASSVSEISKSNDMLTFKELYQAGMNVGRDIMGAMTNTLILAYAGSALPLMLLATQIAPNKLVNLDLFATEVASALSGSLGLVVTIPITAFTAAKMMSQNKSNNE
ncbi:YibE/F family protein [bacterium]|nr:YibE/F family protein [bacterium]QQR58698.1 MAG: YibE/F family protein [Candidatus Melainabacteria bacterium]